MKKTLIAIDGNSLMHRAFWALPPLKDKNGVQVNGIYGFYTMLMNMVDGYHPDYLAVAFDLKGKTFRHEEFEAYKAGRQKTPEELNIQFPLLRESLEKMGICVLSKPSYEADDILGCLSQQASQQGVHTYILTGDRDSLQLVGEEVEVILTKKGVTETVVVDTKALEEMYGLAPQQIVDLKGLMGDSSDNIPGIAGVGEKTALKLLHQYHTIDGIYEHIDQMPANKLREKLIGGKDMAYLSKKLATIERDFPLDKDLKDMEFHGFGSAAQQVFDEFSFKSLRKRVAAQQGGENTVTQEQTPAYETREIASLEEVKQVAEQLKQLGEFSMLLEGDALYLFGREQVKIPCEDNLLSTMNLAGVLETLKPLLEDETIGKQLYDIKGWMHLLDQLDIRLAAPYEDAMLAQYVINPSKRDFSMEKLADHYEVQKDACGLMEICRQQRQALEKNQLMSVLEDIEIPMAKVLFYMEKQGFRVDKNILEELKTSYEGQITALENAIYQSAGEKFNINSPKQLGSVLFETLGLPVIKKTKTGYSTNADVLERLMDQHEIIPLIMEYREITKLKSTYIDGLIALAGPSDGKIHTTFHQTATVTGRLSSTEPNLQNIPVKSEKSKDIRRAFIPSREGGVIIGADYSQIELRILAHLAQDEHMIDAFLKGEDIHRRTASQVFHVPPEEVTPLMRSSAKAVNFGIVYGISDFGLAQNLKIPRATAKEYIETYLKEFSGVKGYMDDIIAKAQRDGYVRTMFGRIRYIDELKSSNYNVREFGKRAALNTPVQGAAADIMKIATIRAFDAFQKHGLTSKIILQVHDELIVDGVQEEQKQVASILKEAMEGAAQLTVPLKVNVSVGQSWEKA